MITAAAHPCVVTLEGNMPRHTSITHGLSQVPLFAGLSEKELAAVRSLLTESAVPAGAVLAREGATGHEFFIIESGTAAIERDGQHVADVGPGDFQGELSLFDGGPRNATVTATTPMVILVATRREFTQLLESTPVIALRMIPALVRRLRAVASHHAD